MATRVSPHALGHVALRKSIVASVPQAVELRGSNGWTVIALPLILSVHWGIASYVGQYSWVIVGMVAFLFGQIVIHQAGSLLHETAHRLVFHNRTPKLLFDLGLEVILASYSRQLTYQYEHVTSHHAHLGDYENDYEHEDICHLTARQAVKANSPGQQRVLTIITLLIHGLPLGFLFSGQMLPRIYEKLSGRLAKDRARKIFARKVPWRLRFLFVAVSISSNLTLVYFWGWYALLYHVWSLSFFLGKLGFTNLGQSLSEHDGDDAVNPTYSDYRITNLILFNTGHHNEHHTFPDVPWNRLPKLRALAPSHFAKENPLNYFSLWWRHVTHDFSPSRKSALSENLIALKCDHANSHKLPTVSGAATSQAS